MCLFAELLILISSGLLWRDCLCLIVGYLSETGRFYVERREVHVRATGRPRAG